MAPSYLRTQGLLPEAKTIHPALTMSKIEDEEQDPSERERMEAAGEYRRRQRRHLQRQEGGEYDELDDGKQEEEENRL